MGRYAGQFPNKKKKKKQQTTILAKVEDFAARFQREFSLCTRHVDRERESIVTSVRIFRHLEVS